MDSGPGGANPSGSSGECSRRDLPSTAPGLSITCKTSFPIIIPLLSRTEVGWRRQGNGGRRMIFGIVCRQVVKVAGSVTWETRRVFKK
ncbi:hypothetical protein NDU88_001502 [Pleurodeles waltl]|uniref:Uncharacterized protein n=1 Tax=Pleurodeles waltl TaxID=8319 RepID=A0AAV7LXU3_PLEWA|nr:hypothetical protein NDU88_001502 [Pleurodeles waltl]